MDGMVDGDTEGFWLGLFASVDAMDGLSPKVQLPLGWIGIGVPSDGSRAFSEILVSSISKRCMA